MTAPLHAGKVRPHRDVTLSPTRIGDIARAALVLNGIWK